MKDSNPLGISTMTLKLVKLYAPKMGVSLPLDHESLYTIYHNFYRQEVSYAMEAEEVKQQKGDWMTIEEKSNIFANAADELSNFDEEDKPDYGLLTEMVCEVKIGSDDVIPEYVE